MILPAPHRVAVLVLPGVFPLEFGTVMQVFGRDENYQVTVCSERPGMISSTGFSLSVPSGLDALRFADTVVVPGCEDNGVAPSPLVLEALRGAHAAGARIASICAGAFVLAAAGLLDGRRATTHWQRLDELAQQYPQTRVDDACFFVDDGDILTSAGVTAGIDLCLHLLRRDLGPSAANKRARSLVVSPYRPGDQRQLAGQLVHRARGDDLAGIRAWILENLSEHHDIDSLARRAHMSRRTFLRRFRQETGSSPTVWITASRIDHARTILETTDAPIERLGALTGLGSPASVRALFAKYLGTSPRDYRAAFRGPSSAPPSPGPKGCGRESAP
ncbi:GlxA family transcriptional regulator [Flexivirga sp. B27]